MPSGAVIAPARDGAPELNLAFIGADGQARMSGERRGSSRAHYLVGPRSSWRTNLPAYQQVRYHDLWPGIDAVFSGTASRLKYEFVVEPHANPHEIRLRYEGAERLALRGDGALRVVRRGRDLVDSAPVSFQTIKGGHARVSSRFAVMSDDHSTFGFRVGSYDESKPLVIDPGIAYSKALRFDVIGGWGIDTDAEGSTYITGTSSETLMTGTPGSYSPTARGYEDAFLMKVDATGTLVYSTFIGGSIGHDEGLEVAVGPDRTAYVVGRTGSSDYPTTAGVLDRNHGGASEEGFVSRLSADGSSLLYSTLVTGTRDVRDIAVRPDGGAVIVGEAYEDFPVTADAFDRSRPGGMDDGAEGYVARLDSDASRLIFASFLGGHSDDFVHEVRLDGASAAYATGRTFSEDFPTTAAAFDSTKTRDPLDPDIFIMKVAEDGALVYSTFLGGAGHEEELPTDLLVAGGSAVVGGQTASPSFPVTSGAVDETFNGEYDGFLTRVSEDGSHLEFSTYLGGDGIDNVTGVGIDGSERIYAAVASMVNSVGALNLYRFAPDGALLDRENADDLGYPFDFDVDQAGVIYAVSGPLQPQYAEEEVHASGAYSAFASRSTRYRLARGFVDCTISGSAAGETLIGTAGPDIICGGGGADVIEGLDGADILIGGDGADVISAGRGVDVVRAGDGSDHLRGGGARDLLLGGGNNDVIFGGGGSDIIGGGDGPDRASGEAGHDRVAGGGGDDYLVGGRGRDVARGGGGLDRCLHGFEVARDCERAA